MAKSLLSAILDQESPEDKQRKELLQKYEMTDNQKHKLRLEGIALKRFEADRVLHDQMKRLQRSQDSVMPSLQPNQSQ